MVFNFFAKKNNCSRYNVMLLANVISRFFIKNRLTIQQCLFFG